MSEPSPPGVAPPDAAVARGDGLAGHSIELFVAQIASSTGYFAAVLVIARELGAAGRGTFAFVTVAALLVGRAASLGVADASAVLAAKHPDRRPPLLASVGLIAAATSLTVSAALALTLTTLMPPGEPAGIDDVLLIALVGGAFATASMDAVFGFLLGCSRFRPYAVGTAVASWAYALLLIVLVLVDELSVRSAAFSWMAGHLLAALVGFAYAATAFGIQLPTLAVLRECLVFGLRASVGTFSRFLSFRADQVLMGFLTTEAVLGIYAVAVNASEILLYLPWAAAMAFLPLSASGRLSAPAQVLSTFRMLVIASLASIVLAVIVGPPLLPLVFGSEFEGSVTPFLILIPAPIGYSAIWLFSNALLAASRPGRASVGPFSSLVIGLALAAALIPVWEAKGAALAATLGYLAGGIVAAAAFRTISRVQVADFVPRPADARSLLALIRRRPEET